MTGEEALRQLEVATGDLQSAVGAEPPALADGESFAEQVPGDGGALVVEELIVEDVLDGA